MWKYLQNTLTSKPPPVCLLSHVSCQVAGGRCQGSYIMCHIYFVCKKKYIYIYIINTKYIYIKSIHIFIYLYLFYKVVEQVSEGSVINGATPSSFVMVYIHILCRGLCTLLTYPDIYWQCFLRGSSHRFQAKITIRPDYNCYLI